MRKKEQDKKAFYAYIFFPLFLLKLKETNQNSSSHFFFIKSGGYGLKWILNTLTNYTNFGIRKKSVVLGEGTNAMI